MYGNPGWLQTLVDVESAHCPECGWSGVAHNAVHDRWDAVLTWRCPQCPHEQIEREVN